MARRQLKKARPSYKIANLATLRAVYIVQRTGVLKSHTWTYGAFQIYLHGATASYLSRQ